MQFARANIAAYLRLTAMLIGAFFLASTAHAQTSTCGAASSGGTAPPSWPTYCWIDMANYNDAQARSAAGQSFSITLTDGTVLSFTLNTTTNTASGANAITAPSWTGAAVGNSAFLGIPGRPVLYMANSGATVTFTFSNITVTPPPGVAAVTEYAFVAADAESTDNAEFLEFTTNGGAWELLDEVPPISGSQMPIPSGEGTATFRSDGGGQTGRVGAHIIGSNSPTNVTATMQGAGLQGMMFALRFASITLSKEIGGVRLDAGDQFDFSIESQSTGTVFASGSTNGTGLGPFDAAVLTTASGIPLRVRESMSSGSTSAIASYQSLLTCTNDNTGSTTPLPTGVATTDYNFGSLQFGDAVDCIFTNTPLPHITYTKALGAGGRRFDTDQFRLRIRDRTTSSNLATVDTTGTGSTLASNTTGLTEVTSGNLIRLREFERGTTDLNFYTADTVCTNANPTSTTLMPGSGAIADLQLAVGDVVTCTLTNTKDPANAVLVVEKSSSVITNDIEASDHKAIPGAVVEYTISVRNEGDAPVDVDTLDLTDIVPPQVEFDVASGVSLTEGATASGLNAFDQNTMVSFSDQPVGAAPYAYSPSGAYDGNVTGILIEPSGSLSASNGADHPSFTITYRMRLE